MKWEFKEWDFRFTDAFAVTGRNGMYGSGNISCLSRRCPYCSCRGYVMPDRARDGNNFTFCMEGRYGGEIEYARDETVGEEIEYLLDHHIRAHWQARASPLACGPVEPKWVHELRWNIELSVKVLIWGFLFGGERRWKAKGLVPKCGCCRCTQGTALTSDQISDIHHPNAMNRQLRTNKPASINTSAHFSIPLRFSETFPPCLDLSSSPANTPHTRQFPPGPST